jgi:hypothetical protein
MDERKHLIPPNQLYLRPASSWTSAVGDSPTADLAKSDDLVARERQRHSDQSELCRNDLANEPSVVVYYSNEEEVSRGFLIALRAMGVAVVEQPPEPAKPPVARAKP